MKKYVIILITLFISISIVVLLLPINYFGTLPQKSDFELNADSLQHTYKTDEEIHIRANLRNKTFHSYVVSHGFKIISITHSKYGMDKDNAIVPAIGKLSYIGPCQSFATEDKVKMNEPGFYTIYIASLFRINDVLYEYNKSFNVLIN